MPLLATADGRLEYLETGTGAPVTVFGHGLAGSISDTRPLGSGVAGRRVFFHFRGHGDSSAAVGWSYPALAGDLRTVADGLGASRAVGVSMGAGALTALLAGTPDRFERVVFFLPGALDQPRAGPALAHLAQLADAVDAGDEARLAGLLAGELPALVRDRPGARAYVDSRAAMMLGAGPAMATALRSLPGQVPADDRKALAAVGVPALVVAQAGDELHPVSVAEELAGALGQAKLKVFDSGSAVWLARSELRAVVAGFLNA